MRRDVCPNCMVHTEPGCITDGKRYEAFMKRFRCPLCGKSYPLCEWRRLDASEKAAAVEREREYKREWSRAHPGHRKESYDRHRDEICLRNRIRYRTDAEYRKRHNEQGRRWYAENRERDNERSRRYYAEHKDEIRVKQKLRAFQRAKEERGEK